MCAAADRHAQEAQNMKTVTVRRHVTDLTASTPFAKPPVRKMKDQLGDTSNNISKFNITFSLFSRLYTGFSRKELQLMYRSFKQVIAKKKFTIFSTSSIDLISLIFALLCMYQISNGFSLSSLGRFYFHQTSRTKWYPDRWKLVPEAHSARGSSSIRCWLHFDYRTWAIEIG